MARMQKKSPSPKALPCPWVRAAVSEHQGMEKGQDMPFTLSAIQTPPIPGLQPTLSLYPAVSPAPFLPGRWVPLVSSLAPPITAPPLALTHLGDSLSSQSEGEKTLTEPTPVVMAAIALIIVCSLVPSLWEGGGERDEGGGEVKPEP